MLTVYGYGSTGGTDPGTSVPATSAPYGNSTWSYYPSGTAPYSTGTDPTTTYGTIGATGDPSVTKTIASTGDPSGAAGSTGLDPSGKPTYTAPTGIPSEYYYHHKKPKRNVRRCSSSFQHPTAMEKCADRSNTSLPSSVALAIELETYRPHPATMLRPDMTLKECLWIRQQTQDG